MISAERATAVPRNHDLRLFFVALCCTVWALVIAARLFQLQVLGHSQMLKEAKRPSWNGMIATEINPAVTAAKRLAPRRRASQ